ncbi:family 2 glycosyl hydrolase [Thozetella sp. PMI_491]|nr:family 2 glycosyl hydrolase [Thozetella sp. PMI_491]
MAMEDKGKQFPASTPDWNNLKVIHRNTLAPRSYFFVFGSEEDALASEVKDGYPTRAKAELLSGRWLFQHSPSPLDGNTEFYKQEFEALQDGVVPWTPIQVPGMWQMQGFGRPQYTNIDFPFPADPPNVPIDDNECGRYVRRFFVDKEDKGHQLRLRFEGVDSAFTVWVNDREVGYSQGSRNPSEFDITKHVEFGANNMLYVEVYQRCDGSYIEDQDQWWLSGIFRDVWIHKFPEKRIEDFHVHTLLDDNYQNAKLRVEVKLNGTADLQLRLLDADGKEVANKTEAGAKDSVHLTVPVKGAHKWSAEHPYLYTLTLAIEGCAVTQKVGFRQVDLIRNLDPNSPEGGVFCVNGRPVKFRGTNRHEHHPDSGRAVPYEFLKHDLLLMKQHNINAIRTSHYPNDPRMYDLADELGLWLIDEADLECHGFGNLEGPAESWTSDNPDWKEAYLDRARQMVARDYNHPSIVLWSLGNESFYGRNHKEMAAFIRSVDSSRLIHYEADWRPETADVYSGMYLSHDFCNVMLHEHGWTKPAVLCEYVHAMGNGPGAIKEYIDLFYSTWRAMGGFVWEWANHGLRTKTSEGVEFFGYGGDFGDDPNDENFVMDGLCTSRHTPNPGLIEYAKAIEPVQTVPKLLGNNKVEVINRYDFIGIDHLKARWWIVHDGGELGGREITIPSGVEPHKSAVLTLEGLPSSVWPGSYLNLEFALSKDTNWASAGHVVATGQIELVPPASLQNWLVPRSLKLCPTVQTERNSTLLQIVGTNGSGWKFDLTAGNLSAWTRPGSDMNLLSQPLVLDIYRASTDNDLRGAFHWQWRNARVHQAKAHIIKATWKQAKSGVEIVVQSRIAPPVQHWSIETTTTYRFAGDYVSIQVVGEPKGERAPETLPRFGLGAALADCESVRWFGRGPGESYRDMKESQLVGTWHDTVDNLFIDYEFPQENGLRTDVRWVEFLGPQAEGTDEPKRLLRARFGDFTGAGFQAQHYSAKDLDAARHPHELYKMKRKDTVIHLDWEHNGLGTGSCGPNTLPQYQLQTGDKRNADKPRFDFAVILD